jgi:pimeloyl-ACP methyl ester carboxylesterase
MTLSFPKPDRTGSAAGVPYLAFAPITPRPNAPLVVIYHLMDPPRTPEAMAAALPLADVDAWRVYLALPMTGRRMPEGGLDEVMRRVEADGMMLLLAPAIEQAAAELPGAVAALRQQLASPDAPLGLVGGSAGGAAVLLALAESDIEAATAVLINPATSARAIVATDEQYFGKPYEWTPERTVKADYLDFPLKADQIAARRRTPMLFVVGEDEENIGLLPATEALQANLAGLYGDHEAVALAKISGLGHALAEEPGLEPAPQIPGAIEVDARVTAWLQHYLGALS